MPIEILQKEKRLLLIETVEVDGYMLQYPATIVDSKVARTWITCLHTGRVSFGSPFKPYRFSKKLEGWRDIS